MTEEELELARSLVKCPLWEWLPGSRALGKYGDRYPIRFIEFGERPFDPSDYEDDESSLEWWQQPEQLDGGPYPGPYVPDLNDYATVSLIQALAEKHWGSLHVRSPDEDPKVTGWWEVEVLTGEEEGRCWGGRSRAMALGKALLAACT